MISYVGYGYGTESIYDKLWESPAAIDDTYSCGPMHIPTAVIQAIGRQENTRFMARRSRLPQGALPMGSRGGPNEEGGRRGPRLVYLTPLEAAPWPRWLALDRRRQLLTAGPCGASWPRRPARPPPPPPPDRPPPPRRLQQTAISEPRAAPSASYRTTGFLLVLLGLGRYDGGEVTIGLIPHGGQLGLSRVSSRERHQVCAY